MIRWLAPKAYAALLHYLALAPLYLLPAAALPGSRLWLAAALPVPALLLTGWAGRWPAKRRTAGLILAAVVMAWICYALFAAGNPLGMLLYIPCIITLFTFMPAVVRPAYREWTVKQLGLGIVVHIAAQVLLRIESFQPAAAALSWLFTAYLLAFLFAFNQSTLRGTGSTASKTLLSSNRKLLMVLCLLALAVASIQSIATAIRAAFTWVVTAVIVAVDWLLSVFFIEQPDVQGQGMASFEGLADAAEPAANSQLLEIILIVISSLAAAAMLFFLLKNIIKLLRKALYVLMERLKRYRQRITADYEDASETLLDWGELRKTAGARISRVKKRLLPTPWEKLAPAQRVRRVYALLLRRADTPDPARTAREMLQSGALRLPEDAALSAAALYDRARYSAHPITAQEADALRKQAGV